MCNDYNYCLKQWSANYHPQVKTGLLPALHRKSNWNSVMAIHLHIVHGDFVAATESSSSAETIWPATQKHSLPGLLQKTLPRTL